MLSLCFSPPLTLQGSEVWGASILNVAISVGVAGSIVVEEPSMGA